MEDDKNRNVCGSIKLYINYQWTWFNWTPLIKHSMSYKNVISGVVWRGSKVWHDYHNCFLITFPFLGISGKSQILFAIVYFSRYLDLFTTYISLYNTSMKLIFMVSSFGTLYLMYIKFRATYDHNHDSFRIEFLLVPCVILALLINHDFTVLEVSFEAFFCDNW